MFTGLVEAMGRVAGLERVGAAARLVIQSAEVADGVSIGDSIAINGCCLTVVERADNTMAFEAGEETLSRTNLGDLQPGHGVNLERSLRVGDRMGGHFVTGHIDVVGSLSERIDDEEWSTCWFSLPRPFAFQLVEKGSVAVDGVSLTVVDVTEERFSVALIPHTLSVTTLGQLQPGDRVNLETDVLAKYVARAIEATRA